MSRPREGTTRQREQRRCTYSAIGSSSLSTRSCRQTGSGAFVYLLASSPLLLTVLSTTSPHRIIRKLRYGMSLKRAGANFVLDCTSQRSHKTSKLCAQTLSPCHLLHSLTLCVCMCSYGPSITTLSPLLSNVIKLYLQQLEFDAIEDPTPYLFHPQSMTTRCVGSSQWTAMVKAAFLKHSGSY